MEPISEIQTDTVDEARIDAAEPDQTIDHAAGQPVDRPATGPAGESPRVAGVKSLPQAVAELEAQAIREALAATGGNKLAASRLLGISRATLYEKLA